MYGALLLAAYDPAADLFRTVSKCGTGFTDADLAALPERLAPLAAPAKPARVDARQQPDIWFEPGLVLEILSAELTLSPNYSAAWGVIKPDAGLAMRFPRFTGRWRDDKAPETPPPRRSWSICSSPSGGHRQADYPQSAVTGRASRAWSGSPHASHATWAASWCPHRCCRSSGSPSSPARYLSPSASAS